MSHRRPPRAATLALAGLTLLLGHQLGYTLVGDPARGHDHLTLLGITFAAAATAAGWVAALRVLRRSPWSAPDAAELIGLQLAGYLVLEVGERWLGAVESSLLSPAVAAGLLAQPVLALVSIALVRRGRVVLERVVAAAPSPAPRGPGVRLVLVPPARPATRPAIVAAARGPPR